MTSPSTAPIRWPAEAIWEAVAPALPGFTVEILPEVDSTNSELMRRARAGRLEPVLLVAEQQTAGRGRMGRQWHSGAQAAGQRGQALTFSLGLNLAPADWSGLSLAVGLSVAQSLHPDIRLKWPNDLWWHDRKLAGILIETANWGELSASRYVVIGVGINLATPDATGLSTPPVGLRELLPEVDAAQALFSIAAPLVQTVQRFEAHGFAPFQQAFNARDALAQLPLTLSDGVHGVAQGVDAAGALLVATAQGMQRVTSSEVSVRVQQGPAYVHL
ncbi:biotin--[acetyl-CoA-carboxylase] ligase [Rhodoferax sp.]|uniref:biotin--[acetyl-CoA-carboxylase] ligase n=1 Tax=Rhodoferax sp. TaxID=50421 RepID=UPI0027374032|nr:biotin--[acetyl-CoA-carboxylase] ligase [Rhodoferax sp.]MDP3192181.1 biotin--[acetyl-CoA-carboxylase] ligase [Rhodoferax sp.]MDP3336840.1 biotin--[acetyl-CoA-carboxylase] ligase [Rhodoferax sp.]MDP3864321.1 biotin--[acetyl-CoA-carboxylase] ligase [Rhodoferax sp.]